MKAYLRWKVIESFDLLNEKGGRGGGSRGEERIVTPRLVRLSY